MVEFSADPSSGASQASTHDKAPIQIGLASCLLGAAVIHLAMATSHAAGWLPEGVAFAIAGWLQLAMAAMVLWRPSKSLLAMVCGAHVTFLAAWAWTRTVGMPFGPEAGSVHDVGFVDLVVVALELGIVALSARRMMLPSRPETTRRIRLGSTMIAPIGVLVVVTAAIVSPSATDHQSHENHGGTEETQHHGSLPESIASTPADHHEQDLAAGTEGSSSSVTHVADSEHGHTDSETSRATDGTSSTISLAAADENHHLATSQAAAAEATAEHGHDQPATEAAAFDDRGLALLENGDMAHAYGPDESLDAATRTALAHQLALTRVIAEQYPTLGDARAAGSRAAGAFGPGLGLHMSVPTSWTPDLPEPNPSVPSIPGTLTDAEILHPSNLLYSGFTDDAPLAGFMYYSMGSEEPEGFAGPNDHWHTHGSLCLDMGGQDGIEVLHPTEKTKASCESVGGFFVEQTGFMVHVWTIPGYESNRGVFSDVNPAIACPDGTYFTVPESETEQYQLSKCLTSPA